MTNGILTLFAIIIPMCLGGCGLVYCIIELIYDSINSKSFNIKAFWISLGCTIALIFGILSLIDFSAYEKKLKNKAITATLNRKTEVVEDSKFIEEKTYTVEAGGKTFENLKEGTFYTPSVAKFKISSTEYIYFHGDYIIYEDITITPREENK